MAKFATKNVVKTPTKSVKVKVAVSKPIKKVASKISSKKVEEKRIPVKTAVKKSATKIIPKPINKKVTKKVESKAIKKILVAQPRPESEKSPYFELERKYNIELDFCPFILVEGVPAKDFRKQRVEIKEYTAIIFNSRNAIDHFFRIVDELKIKISPEMKYFCITEAIALYLQKFIV